MATGCARIDRQEPGGNHSELLDRMPPHSLEAERGVLGSILLQPSLMATAFERLGPLDFHADAHQRIFAALYNLHTSGKQVDVALVTGALRLSDDLERLGGLAYLAEIVHSVPVSAHFESHVATVVEHAARRKIILEVGQALRRAYNPDCKPAELAGELVETFSSMVNQGAVDDRFKMLTAAELDAADCSPEYVVQGVLSKGAPAVIGGLFKSLKTTIGLDLLLSIVSGTPFLGQFPVLRQARGVYFLGEGGTGFLQEVSRRIAESKGLRLSALDGVGFFGSLPALDRPEDVALAVRKVREFKAEFAFFDPLYIGLGGVGAEARNVFSMGDRLGLVNRACADCGCTPILVHHFNRHRAATGDYGPATLADLSQAGLAEFAGQWALLARQRPFDEERPGEHVLWLSLGSRLGYSSRWAIEANEGASPARYWAVDMSPASEALATAREEQTTRKQAAKEETQRAGAERDKQVLFRALAKHPAGLTQTDLRTYAGFSGTRCGQALASALQAREVEACQVIKMNRKQPYDGFRLKGDLDAP